MSSYHQIIKLLLWGTPEGGESPLHISLKHNLDDIAELLIHREIYINHVYGSETPLSIACFQKKIDIVKLLIEKGALVDSVDASALIESLKVKGNLDIVKLLYSKGAVLPINESHLVASDISYYLFYQNDVRVEFNSKDLLENAINRNIDVDIFLLLHCIYIEKVFSLQEIFLYCIKQGNYEITKKLIEHTNVDINGEGSEITTNPLYMLCHFQFPHEFQWYELKPLLT